MSGSRPAPKLSSVRPMPNLSGVRSAPNLQGGLRTPDGIRTSSSSLKTVKADSARKSGEDASAKKSGASKPPKKKLTKAQKEKKKRLDLFRKADLRRSEEGEPFNGHLAFGVGETGRGLKHVIIIYGMAFVVLNLLVSVAGYGQREFNVVSDEPMIYIRSAVLVVFGIVGIVGLRRESIGRIGIAPELFPTLLTIPIAAIIGLFAMPIARLPVGADANLGMVVGLLAVRAIGEGVFFHGFVTRTLLIEMRESSTAMFISAILYGFYALTFAMIADGSPTNIVFGVLVYGFGSGMPLAMMYWKTRSVLIPIVAQLIIFVMVAIAGMQYAAKFGAVG